MCGVVEIWARGSRGWKREEAEETRNFCLTRSGSDLGFKRAILFSGGGGGVKEAEEWHESWFSFFVLLRRSEEWCESFGVFLFSGVSCFGYLERDGWEFFFFFSDVVWSDWLA